MRYFAVNAIIILLLAGCSGNAKYILKQDMISGIQIGVGKADRRILESPPFHEWFLNEYSGYKIDSLTLAELPKGIYGTNFSIVLGNWCVDSRREVPRFFKVLDYLQVNDKSVNLIMVDRDKKSLNASADSLNINYVPTFIFYFLG